LLTLKNGGFMSIIKRNNGTTMTNLFDDIFSKDLFNWGLDNYSGTATSLPGVNIRENAEHFLVEMAAPGMNKEDFKIELDGNNLTISSQRTQADEPRQDERYTRREFSYQSFQRSFTLPKDVVDIDHIQAKYQNGVLNLVIPKKEEAKQKPPRMIQIS